MGQPSAAAAAGASRTGKPNVERRMILGGILFKR
jgi:hypothetical protein